MIAPNDPRFADLADPVTDLDALRDTIRPPMPQVLAKEIDRLDPLTRDFLARSPFCLLATSDPDGVIDVSPRGDPPGFIHVIDDRRIALPDRPGNRRVDSFSNILKDPRVGLIVLIPGKQETLRLSGEARIVRDPALRQAMAVDGKVPALALVIHLTRGFFHCPKALIRSHLWESDEWPDSAGIASIGQAMIAHGKLDTTEDALFQEALEDGVIDLY